MPESDALIAPEYIADFCYFTTLIFLLED